MSQPILSILVPVYNEEKTIKHVLEKVTSLPIKAYEVLVVDDMSKDKSRQIIEEFSKVFASSDVDLKVLSHERNRGKGAGIKTGLEHAAGKYFIVQDADLEYDPADIPALLDKAVAGGHRAIYGSRFKGEFKNMPKANYYANRFYNFVLRRLYNTAITDMHTCYKMVRTDIMRELDMTSEGFGYATELVSKLLKRGITINEGPIRFNGRTKQQGKKIGIKDGLDCLYMLFKYKFAL
ncbi:MAG TPA: glycosyltransferase family 2 protein [Candidatus Saccharimonadia bacterium]|nr:glycosyltransferase family 2 protein [Candidatus Saccharimonadia bacterium]